MDDFDQNLNLSPPASSSRRPITPGLSSGGLLVRPYLYFSQLSPTIREKCLSACSSESMSTGVAQALTYKQPDSPRVQPGTYIAFALATQIIADQFPRGSEAYEAVRTFPRSFYIGLVSDSFTFISEENGALINEVIVHYVSRSTPSPSSMSGHCIPIDLSSAESPRGPPLRTTTFFPYVDCNQWTTMGVKLTAEQVHDSSLVFALEDEEFARFEDLAVADYEHMSTLETSNYQLDEVESQNSNQYALASEIWRDVRIGDEQSEPSRFIAEVKLLESIVSQYSEGK